MSFKSMESVLNLFNNKPLKTQYSKESIIYSTELVNDMRKLVKYDALVENLMTHSVEYLKKLI